MSDLISRQDAIKVLKSNYDLLERATLRTDKARRDEISAMMAKIMSLPSAEPKTVECTGCKCIGSYDLDFSCVNCVRKTKDYYCGADMRGGDDE